MARQLKLPMARVLPRGVGAPMSADLPENERIMIVDMEKVRLSKTYAQLRVQAAAWDEAACDEYVLSLIAQGVC